MCPSGSGLLDIDRPHSGARSDGSTGDGRSRLDVDPTDYGYADVGGSCHDDGSDDSGTCHDGGTHDGRANHDGATWHNPRLDNHHGRCAWRPAVHRAGRHW